MNRAMTQMEVVNAMKEELGESISQAYLSQLESGKRLHLTASTRDLLARFFKVHPGYLVSDPPDYSVDLLSEMEDDTDRLETWLYANAAEWRAEPELHDLLQWLAEAEDPRRIIAALNKLADLSIEGLEAVVEALTNHKDEVDAD